MWPGVWPWLYTPAKEQQFCWEITYCSWAPGLHTEGIKSHLSALCEPFHFQGEQKFIHSPGTVVIQLSFGPLGCKCLCCSPGHMSHGDICLLPSPSFPSPWVSLGGYTTGFLTFSIEISQRHLDGLMFQDHHCRDVWKLMQWKYRVMSRFLTVW